MVWAGGLWDGADLHRALLAGAAGIQLGTRFFFCEESPLHPSIKAQLVRTNSKRPLTTALTPVTGTLNMRFVVNKPFKKGLTDGTIVETFQDKEKVFALSEAFFAEQARPLLIYAGAAACKLKEVEPAAAILSSIEAEYAALRTQELPTWG